MDDPLQQKLFNNVHYTAIMEENIYEKEIGALRKLYPNEKKFIRDATRALLEMNPSLKIEMAIRLYTTGEISLWKASEISGFRIEEFKELLKSRGIKIEIASSLKESDERLKKVFGD